MPWTHDAEGNKAPQIQHRPNSKALTAHAVYHTVGSRLPCCCGQENVGRIANQSIVCSPRQSLASLSLPCRPQLGLSTFPFPLLVLVPPQDARHTRLPFCRWRHHADIRDRQSTRQVQTAHPPSKKARHGYQQGTTWSRVINITHLSHTKT